MADRRRPNVVLLVIGAVAVLAVAAVLIGSSGGDDDSSSSGTTIPETLAVEVTGTPLPAYDRAGPDPAVGTAAPVVAGTTHTGDPVTIGAKGPAIVVFVAHWCPHCQREVPFLVSYFADKGMPQGIDVYGVSTGITPARPNYPPSAWLEREHWTAPTLVDDEQGTAGQAFGLTSFPYFVALDKDGKVAARGVGELEAADLEALFDKARS